MSFPFWELFRILSVGFAGFGLDVVVSIDDASFTQRLHWLFGSITLAFVQVPFVIRFQEGFVYPTLLNTQTGRQELAVCIVHGFVFVSMMSVMFVALPLTVGDSSLVQTAMFVASSISLGILYRQNLAITLTQAWAALLQCKRLIKP